MKFNIGRFVFEVIVKKRDFDLVKKLRDLREERGISMMDMANSLGITRTFLWQIESSGHNPGDEIVRKMAKKLRVKVSRLIKYLE